MSKDIKDIRLDYGEALKKVMEDEYYRYRGALAVRRFSGYVWSGCFYSHKDSFQEAVDRTYGVIENSIKK